MESIVTNWRVGETIPLGRDRAVVTDFAAYPEWNPFIRRISGDLREGTRLEVRIAC